MFRKKVFEQRLNISTESDSRMQVFSHRPEDQQEMSEPQSALLLFMNL